MTTTTTTALPLTFDASLPFAKEAQGFADRHRGLHLDGFCRSPLCGNAIRATWRFASIESALSFIAAHDFTSTTARSNWEGLVRDKNDAKWRGNVSTAAEWADVVSNPGDSLRAKVQECMDALDAVPTAFDARPSRRTKRGLEAGDVLDPVRMIEDRNLDRAWSERQHAPRFRPVLRVALNAELSSNQGETELAWRGATALAIARKAEEAGADVELSWITIGDSTCSDYTTQMMATVPVKRIGHYADRDSLVAYCCHLGSFRYFGFNLIAALNPSATMTGWGRPRALSYAGPEWHVLIDWKDANNRDAALALIAKAAGIVGKQLEEHGGR